MRLRPIAGALVAAILLAVPTVGAEAAPGDTYVALGDSYTSAPFVPNQTGIAGCLRSDRNSPHLVAPAISAAVFRDVSCGGATTNDMFSPQNVFLGPNPPQLEALDAGTDVVTLEIGGNDIGFSSIIQNCAVWHPFGSPCRNQYTAGGVDQISARITATAPKVANVLAAIRSRAPGARVFVLGYPAILPDTGSGCWPSMPLAWNDVPFLRAKHKELNAMLAARAGAGGATYVDVYTPSIGKDACKSSSVRWVEPIIPGNDAAPVHPNARGEAGMAAAVIPAVNS